MTVRELIVLLELMKPHRFVFYEDSNGFLRDIAKIVQDSDGDTILKEKI